MFSIVSIRFNGSSWSDSQRAKLGKEVRAGAVRLRKSLRLSMFTSLLPLLFFYRTCTQKLGVITGGLSQSPFEIFRMIKTIRPQPLKNKPAFFLQYSIPLAFSDIYHSHSSSSKQIMQHACRTIVHTFYATVFHRLQTSAKGGNLWS